jgi:hypothetical protein
MAASVHHERSGQGWRGDEEESRRARERRDGCEKIGIVLCLWPFICNVSYQIIQICNVMIGLHLPNGGFWISICINIKRVLVHEK